MKSTMRWLALVGFAWRSKEYESDNLAMLGSAGLCMSMNMKVNETLRCGDSAQQWLTAQDGGFDRYMEQNCYLKLSMLSTAQLRATLQSPTTARNK